MIDFTILWGNGSDLTVAQMSVRAAVMFIIALLMIRVGGIRIFAKKSSLDTIVAIMMGAVLSRGVTGASSFAGVVAAVTVMMVMHRFISWLCIKNKNLSRWIKGKPMILYSNGQINYHNLKRCSIGEDDLMVSLRLETRSEALDDVDFACMETNGRISFVMKKKQPQ